MSTADGRTIGYQLNGGAAIIAGLDLSLRRSGWAHVDFESGRLLACGAIEPPTNLPLTDRLHYVRHHVRQVITTSVADVFIEAPIAHRSGTTTTRIGMVHGAVRTAIDAPIIEVNPAELKKWATTNGNAGKDAMSAAAALRFGVALPGHDEADAALLAAWGREQVLAAMGHHPGGAA